ncbi:MAG: hypothetical protein KME26_12180 [Oscillatoria princeps RMCB-10]|nr:hypothetical protein [Oscillatoria princeps RMCB-10]
MDRGTDGTDNSENYINPYVNSSKKFLGEGTPAQCWEILCGGCRWGQKNG